MKNSIIEPGGRLNDFLPNPHFGTGIARRKIRLTGTPGRVVGEIEDLVHGMRCILEHDGTRIIQVQGEMIRIPMTTCAGAATSLDELIGMPLTTAFSEFYGNGRPQRNCTHLYDIAWLALVHCLRGEVIRDYEFEMPDAIDGPSIATIRRDGAIIFRWAVLDDVIVDEGRFKGRNVLRGFTKWATATLAGDELEAALVLQKAYFVGQSRRIMLTPDTGLPAEQPDRHGVCYGYSKERVHEARRFVKVHRTFSGDNADDLLRFLP